MFPEWEVPRRLKSGLRHTREVSYPRRFRGKAADIPDRMIAFPTLGANRIFSMGRRGDKVCLFRRVNPAVLCSNPWMLEFCTDIHIRGEPSFSTTNQYLRHVLNPNQSYTRESAHHLSRHTGCYLQGKSHKNRLRHHVT